MNVTPLPNEIYRHVRTNGLYSVLCIATEESTERLVVVYQSLRDKKCWTRPMEEFMDGRFVLQPLNRLPSNL
jgi:hypothetical protein